jgi:Domain of unknown function DUF29
MASTSDIYETDIHAWALDQAARVRGGLDIDAERVAAELEALGRNWEQELENRLAVLIMHMLKCEFQPEKHTRSWDLTVKEQRRRVGRILTRMPSLRDQLGVLVKEAYPAAVTFASAETGIIEEDFPLECPYAMEAILIGDGGGQE